MTGWNLFYNDRMILWCKRSVETLFYNDKVRLQCKRSVETLFYNDKVRLRCKRSVEIRFTQRNEITDGKRMKMKM